MEKKITGYTTVDISQWHRKEHFEAFQSVAQCTYNQTVQLDITAFLKTVKKNNHKFYPAFIHILARLMNAHPEFRMAMKDGGIDPVMTSELHLDLFRTLGCRRAFFIGENPS